jgi:hypothetical protein
MANQDVPQSFEELKARAAAKLRRGETNVQQDIIQMGDAMLQANVEPKSPQDRIAKRVWQAAQPEHKQALADVVAKLAAQEADTADLQ